MQSQSFKQSFLLSLAFTAVWGVIGYVSGGQSLPTTLLQLPFFFALILLTMRGTNWITMKLMNRFGPKPKPPPEPIPPSTERPEHAQRRRGRRRRRSQNRRS